MQQPPLQFSVCVGGGPLTGPLADVVRHLWVTGECVEAPESCCLLTRELLEQVYGASSPLLAEFDQWANGGDSLRVVIGCGRRACRAPNPSRKMAEVKA